MMIFFLLRYALCVYIFNALNFHDRVPVEGRNYHDIIFRAVEIGVALWFPCCLWNVNRPDQLWILNPKKILKTPTKNPADNPGNFYANFDDLVKYVTRRSS